MVRELATAVVALLAVTAVYKVCSLRRDSLPAQVALATVFGCLALGVFPFTQLFLATFEDPVFYGWGQVLARSFVAAAACAAQVYLLLLAHAYTEVRGRVTRRVVGLVLTVGAIITLALLTPTPDFQTAAFDVWPEAATHVIFQVYLAAALADVAAAAGRWSRACDGVVRAGLILVAGGAGLGIVYAVGKVLLTFLEVLVGPSQPLVAACQLAALLGLVLVAVGSALPGIWRSWRSMRHGLQARRQLDDLYPLWSDLVELAPGIALNAVQPRWLDRLHFRDLDIRLYRRIIEIRDGHLALAQSLPTSSQSGSIRVALSRHGASALVDDQPTTVAEEVAWWVDVAASYEAIRRADAATAPHDADAGDSDRAR